MLLQLVECLSLLLNHVTMCEWEVIDSLNSLHSLLIALSLTLLVLQDLVGLDERVDFVNLVILLKLSLFLHLLALELQQTLLVRSIPNLISQLPVSLFVNLVDNLAEKVIVVGAIKDDLLIEAGTSFAIDEPRHERIGYAWIMSRHLRARKLIRFLLLW